MLLYAVQSFAGIEEVSLSRMSTWSSTYSESIGWNASFDPSTKTITFNADETQGHEGYWQRIGWIFLGKNINSTYQSFTIEFASAAATNGQVQVTYLDNDVSKNKYFDYSAGDTSVVCDLQTDFEDADENDKYSLKYINIGQVQGTTLQLSKVYFTTTDNNDLYQAENAEYNVSSLEYLTEADDAIAPITESTHYVDFTINVPYAAVYRLNFGYSTKNGGTKTGNISINNGTGFSFDFTNTGASEVKEVSYSCVLNEGTNHIKVYANWTHFYIDYLRVYEPTLYLLGENYGTDYTSAPNKGAFMTFDSETETFSITTRIGTGANHATAANFYFATVLAENADGWSYMNGHRWGPDAENTSVTTDGNTEITNIAKRGWNSYLVPMAGTYTITIKADLSSFTIQGPEVYMFGLFEGSEYTWATNAYNTMEFNPETDKYTLRVRIADGAETSGDGAVAFATGYSDNNWTYLNANRYGPSSDATPSIDGTTNNIALNGATAFTNIPAAKYEVVVDMFSATKTARFYPLYTFGYEVVGTPAHGSIVCSTNENEIPLGGTPTVTATPDEGYRFVKWTDDSDTQLSTSASYKPTISANTWLKAWFEPDPECSLTISATDFSFAKHNSDIYPAVDNSFLKEATGAVYFDYSANTDGAELYYSVHLDAGTYFFYCALSADGESRAFRLYEPSLSSGDLYYSGKRWNQIESFDFGSGAATFETNGYTLAEGDYLIGLYAIHNTQFKGIDIVGVCNGATDNTYSLTLSADANGSVISDQINNAKIISGTDVLLLAEPASGYRFHQWNDGNTDNPRLVATNSDRVLTASFANASSGCLNTRTIQCTTDSISPTTRPISSPKLTSASGTILTNQEAEKSIYYAFETTEAETYTITLLTPRGDKRQKIYLYSAQLEEGTSLTYSGDTYYQVQDPTDANTSNSGTNHIYPVLSTTLNLAAGKYVIGMYSEYSWSQYDRIVISAAGYGLDCSNADITINAGEQVELPHVVRNLIVHQGGSTTSAHDIKILNTITYIRPAYEAEEGGNKMNKWYPFCLPFVMSYCTVHDEEDGLDYLINPIYLQGGDAADSPSGTGFFYLKYFNEDSKWAYINRNSPEAYKPYIILFVNHWDDTNTDDDYFEQNPIVKFIGGPQKIDGSAKIDAFPAEDVEKYYYYANNTLAPIHLESAYVFDPSRNNFDYKEDVTIPPFECYIQATETYKASHKSIAMPSKPGASNTATGIENTMANHGSIEVFDLMGRRYSLSDISLLPSGVWIVKQGTNISKICVR